MLSNQVRVITIQKDAINLEGLQQNTISVKILEKHDLIRLLKSGVRKIGQSMNIIRDDIKTIERKSLAILSLPVITMNGSMRTVDSALGQELKHFAGFDYKQNSLTKYLSELKYLGVSAKFLEDIVAFWNKCWGT